MIQFIASRILQTMVVLLLLSMLCFSVLQLIPGDPVLAILGNEATQEEIHALREELGLNDPIAQQYVSWLMDMLKGDLGTSIVYNESVGSLIAERLPATLHIGAIALILSICIGIPLGVIAAVRRGSFIDTMINVSANLGMAVPIFWLGIMGILLFSLKLGWLPVQGYVSPTEDFWLNTKQIIMPSTLLALASLSSLARQTRSSMLEVIRQDYVRTARSKGLKEGVIIRKHVLKNAIIPVLTLIGLQLRNVVGGSVLIESVFNINGMGRLLLQGVFDQDIIIVQGGIIIIALAVALSNLLVDISYGYFDPRIRYK